MSDTDNPKTAGVGWFVGACCLGAAVGFGVLVVLPNFVKSRSPHRISCLPNLKHIDGAVQQWALENKLAPTNSYSLADKSVLAYMKGSTLPKCPQGGRYSSGTSVADTPKCSHPGHTL